MTVPLSVTRTRLVVCWGFGLALMVLVDTVESADAQQKWEHRGFLSVNGGFQLTTSDSTDNATFTLFVEEGDFAANYNPETGFVFDASGGARVWRNLAIGVGVSIFNGDSNASIEARIPHPFQFDQHRQVDGTAASLTHQEIGIHVQATWIVPVND